MLEQWRVYELLAEQRATEAQINAERASSRHLAQAYALADLGRGGVRAAIARLLTSAALRLDRHAVAARLGAHRAL